MRQLLIQSFIVSSQIALTSTPAVQAAPQRYEYPQGAYSASDFRDSQLLLAGVRSDLDRAENNLPEFNGGRYRFDRVRGELSELQRQWDESTFEPRQADEVIAALDRALDTNGLLPRDRDRLTYDLSRLRNFRDSHE